MRRYTLDIPAPCEWISANDTSRWTTANRAKLWRHAAYIHARKAKLPTGLGRVRIDAVLHFTDRRHRDAANYHATTKPVVDGLCRDRSCVTKNGARIHAPGYGLIHDDTPTYLDGPHLVIGDVVTPPHRAFPSAGLLVLTIVEVS